MGNDLAVLFAYLAFAALVNWLLYRTARESIRTRRARRAARRQNERSGARVFRMTPSARLTSDAKRALRGKS
jgi:hypothetical protein